VNTLRFLGYFAILESLLRPPKTSGSAASWCCAESCRPSATPDVDIRRTATDASRSRRLADDRSMGKRSPPASDSRQILVAGVLRCELTSEFVQVLRKRRARDAPTLRILAG